MVTIRTGMTNAKFYTEEKLKKMNDMEANHIKQIYPMLPNSELSQIIKVFHELNIHLEVVDFIKSELEWREKARETTLNKSIHKKTTLGLPPKLYFKSHFQVDEDDLHQLGSYILHIMFWHHGIGLNRKWFTLIRPDSNAGGADSLIKLKLNSQNLLEIKCVARGSILVDNERNSRNLTQVLKLIELLAEKENWIRLASYSK